MQQITKQDFSLHFIRGERYNLHIVLMDSVTYNYSSQSVVSYIKDLLI